MAADVSAGGGDVGGAGFAVDADGEVAQAGHDLGSGSGPYLREVLAEAHVADPVQPVLDAPVSALGVGEQRCRGLLIVQVGDEVDDLGGPAAAARGLTSAGQFDRQTDVGKGDGPGCLDDLQAPGLESAVTFVGGDIHGRDLLPEQLLELPVQGRLVAFDREQVVRPAGVEVVRVLGLGMEGIGGDERPGDVEGVQQRRESVDFIGLLADGGLSEDDAGFMIEGSEQVWRPAVNTAGTADGLAVDRDGPRRLGPVRGCRILRRSGRLTARQPARDHLVEPVSIQALQEPTDRRLTRAATSDAEPDPDGGWQIGGPLRDRDELPGPSQDGTDRDPQDGRELMSYPAWIPRIGDLPQGRQQILRHLPGIDDFGQAVANKGVDERRYGRGHGTNSMITMALDTVHDHDWRRVRTALRPQRGGVSRHAVTHDFAGALARYAAEEAVKHATEHILIRGIPVVGWAITVGELGYAGFTCA